MNGKRKKRKAVSRECVEYARLYGAVEASKRFGNHPASINRILRTRNLGRGTPRGPQKQDVPANLSAVLRHCGYRRPEDVKADLKRYA